MNVREIEIVLGYNGRTKKRLLVRKIRLNLKNINLKHYLKIDQLFKNNLTVKDLSIKYLKYQKDILSSKTYITYKYRLCLAMKKIRCITIKELNVKILENFYRFLHHNYTSARNKLLSPTTVIIVL